MSDEYSGIDIFKRMRREADRQRERQDDIEHEMELARIRTQSKALVWTGTEDDLIEEIKRLYTAGFLKADDLLDALRKAAIHFVSSDGKPIIKPASVLADAPKTTPRFTPLDENYQSIEFDGKQYALTTTQSTVIRVLHESLIKKRTSVGLKDIYKAIGTNTGKMSHWFRGKNKILYGKLIVQTASRNHYRLDL